MGIIKFNGISSKDIGVQVETYPNYDTPEKDYELIHIPGRNGDLVVDKGSYKNVTRTYKIAVSSPSESFSTISNRLAEWLYSPIGYSRLEDTYEPEYYRKAMFKSAVTIENVLNQAGRVNISFDCKPQRFLKVGDETQTIYLNHTNQSDESTHSIFNPTAFSSLPIITIYGKGECEITIGNMIIKVNLTDSMTVSEGSISESNPGIITINSDIQDVYNAVGNLNSQIHLPSGFPKLVNDNNNFKFKGIIYKVEVIPKWWTI